MKLKNLILALTIAITGISFGDSYLYWMWDEDFSEVFDYGQVKVIDENGAKVGEYLAYANTKGDDNYKHYDDAGAFYAMYSKLGSTVLDSNYSFVLELCNDKGAIVGVSDALQYNAAYIASSYPGAAQQAEFTGMTVPEPTSGVLALLGFAMLGLRRKQKIA